MAAPKQGSAKRFTTVFYLLRRSSCVQTVARAARGTSADRDALGRVRDEQRVRHDRRDRSRRRRGRDPLARRRSRARTKRRITSRSTAKGHVFVALAFPPADTNAADKHAGHGGSDSVGELLRLDQRDARRRDTRDVDQNPGDVVLTHDQKRVLVTHFDMRRAMQQAKAAAITSTMYARLVVLDTQDARRRRVAPRVRRAARDRRSRRTTRSR